MQWAEAEGVVDAGDLIFCNEEEVFAEGFFVYDVEEMVDLQVGCFWGDEVKLFEAAAKDVG